MPTIAAVSVTIAVAVLLLSACGSNEPPASPTTTPEPPTMATPTVTPTNPPADVAPTASSTRTSTPIPTSRQDAIPVFAYTYIRPDGNRYIDGSGPLPDSRQLDIALAGPPQWLVAAPYRDGSIWVAVLESGQKQAFYVAGENVREVDVTPERLEPGMPPLLRVAGDEASLVTLSSPDQSTLTHPVPLDENAFAYIDVAGDLVVTGESEIGRLALNALPDARILRDEDGRLLLLTGASNRYTHGVLGDEIEATEITLVEPLPAPRVVQTITLLPPTVVEGIAPIWVDVTKDGVRDITVTVSDAEQGARVIAFNEQGHRVGESAAIGQGFRWRHQLAVAPFSPSGRNELATVLTPHIGGTVEFFRFERSGFDKRATLAGYSSHVIGSRNVDMAAAADIDGDGNVELLVPNQALTAYDAVRHTENGAEVVHTLPLQGTLRTNLAGMTFPDRRIGIGAGLDDNRLRLWLPAP